MSIRVQELCNFGSIVQNIFPRGWSSTVQIGILRCFTSGCKFFQLEIRKKISLFRGTDTHSQKIETNISMVSHLRQYLTLDGVQQKLFISNCWTYLRSPVFLFPYVSSSISLLSLSVFPYLWYYQRASWDTKINGRFLFFLLLCTNLPTDSPST